MNLHKCTCNAVHHLSTNTTNTTFEKNEPEIIPIPLSSSETFASSSSSSLNLPKPKDDPLVFNIPEVPNEVRGVFHKNTGSVNYTALVEFVKNMKLNSTNNNNNN